MNYAIKKDNFYLSNLFDENKFQSRSMVSAYKYNCKQIALDIAKKLSAVVVSAQAPAASKLKLIICTLAAPR